MIKVDGKQLPSPTDYLIGIMDIDKNSARTASGMLVRDRVAVKRKIELAWKVLTKAELSLILDAVSPVFFDVEYIDPKSGEKRTGTFYVGDRTAAGLDYVSGEIRWKDVKMNFIER